MREASQDDQMFEQMKNYLEQKFRAAALSAGRGCTVFNEFKTTRQIRLASIEEFVNHQVVAGRISAEPAARLLRRIQELMENWSKMTAQEFEDWAFAERLATRQGTTIPDFEAFYRKLDELDRKTVRPHQSHQ